MKSKELDLALSKLRHLYGHMVNGRASDTKRAAKGLLGPAIEILEKFQTLNGGKRK